MKKLDTDIRVADFIPMVARPLFITLIILAYCFSVGCSKPSQQISIKEKVLYEIDFGNTSDFDHFKPETEINGQEVTLEDGALDIDAIKGATVWFKEKLTAPIKIEYTVMVVEKKLK